MQNFQDMFVYYTSGSSDDEDNSDGGEELATPQKKTKSKSIKDCSDGKEKDKDKKTKSKGQL